MMEVTDQQYQDAIKIIHDYRTERGLDFYMVINVNPSEPITLEQFKQFLSIQKAINDT